MIFPFARSGLILIGLFLLMTASWVQGAVEMSLQKTLQTEAAPIDVKISPDGRLIFVLTNDGNVVVYDTLGNTKDTFKVGPHINQIEIGPRGERLFATSRKNKTVEIILLDFIRNINIEGSAFKGPENAPVIISVFSEFQ